MRGATAKQFRRGAMKVATQTIDALRPPIDAALQNEHKTRARVDDLEAWTKKCAAFTEHTQSEVEQLQAWRCQITAFVRRGFWKRLRWLLSGK